MSPVDHIDVIGSLQLVRHERSGWIHSDYKEVGYGKVREIRNSLRDIDSKIARAEQLFALLANDTPAGEGGAEGVYDVGARHEGVTQGD